MIVNKLDTCHCDSVKLVKETLSHMNRSEFMKDITSAKKSIKKTWNKKCKSRKVLFWKHHRNKRREKLNSFELLKENPCIPRKFFPINNGKETPEDKKYNEKLDKEKVHAKLQLQKI